jgi:prepilin-type N-terminal cleavage/methylation domain-containing protein
MRKRGFSLIEMLVGLAIFLFVFLAALEFFGLTRDLFLKIKNAEEEAQAAAAALDKIRIDLLRAGSGLIGPISQGTIEGIVADGNILLAYRLDEAFALGADISPGHREAVLAVAIPSSSGLRPGREICLSNENQSESRVVSACAGNTVVLSAPLEFPYPQDDSRLLLLEKTSIFLDESSRTLRRKVNASSPQPLMDDVASFECGCDPESKLARAGFVAADDQEKKYEIWVLPKNLALARNVYPAE